MYADDTTFLADLSILGSEPRIISHRINQELECISNWLKSNKLSLNIGKTKFMILHRPGVVPIQFNLEICRTAIEKVNSFLFLGLYINQHMTADDHSQFVAVRMAKSVGVLNRLRNILPKKHLLDLYHAFVMSKIHYQILNWGGTFDRIVKLQKRAVRIIDQASYRSHADPIFKRLQLLKFTDICNVRKLKFFRAYIKLELPLYFLTLPIKRHQNFHNHYTRGHTGFVIPLRNNVYANQIFEYVIPKLSTTFQAILGHTMDFSYPRFVSSCKRYFIDQYVVACTIPRCYVCLNNL